MSVVNVCQSVINVISDIAQLVDAPSPIQPILRKTLADLKQVMMNYADELNLEEKNLLSLYPGGDIRNKIMVIKMYRERTGTGLRVAKQLVDDYVRGLSETTQEKCPVSE